MAANTGIITSSVITATSQHKRDYSEKIRRLYPDLTKILALVKGSTLDAYGKPAVSGKGMIAKRAVKRMDPECAYYTPIDIHYLCTGGSASTAVIADTTFFHPCATIVNTRTLEVGIVTELASGTQLNVAAVTGGTWSCAAGDYIAMLSSTFEEGTSRYHTITNELTTIKTYLQIFREAVSIADTMKNTPQYTEEGMMERYKTDKMIQVLRLMEGAMLMSKQSSSGNTSTTLVGTGDAGTYSLSTMQGLINWAANTINMQGNFNWESINTVLYPQLPNTLKSDETIYMACGRKVAGTMNQWANNKHMIVSENKEVKFGKAVSKYVLGGAVEVELIVHERYDAAGMQDKGLIFQSSDIEYLFMQGMDINVRENAQLPATMGQTDIVEGTIGVRSISNGNNVVLLTNLLTPA